MRNDFRFALRGLMRSPGFAAVAILTLAVGVGATTAIWSVADLVLWRALPVRSPKELVAPRWSAPQFPEEWVEDLSGDWSEISSGFSSDSFSYPYFLRLKKDARSFASVAAMSANSEGLNVRVGGRS